MGNEISRGWEWIRENRCPFCTKRYQVPCTYEVTALVGGGYKCTGYRSEYYAKLRGGAR